VELRLLVRARSGAGVVRERARHGRMLRERGVSAGNQTHCAVQLRVQGSAVSGACLTQLCDAVHARAVRADFRLGFLNLASVLISLLLLYWCPLSSPPSTRASCSHRCFRRARWSSC
jgi:hypothetical protein